MIDDPSDRLFGEHLMAVHALRPLAPAITAAGQRLIACLHGGNTIFVCGNGGSAGEAQQFAAKISGRFETERCGLPAHALTTDGAALTAIGNDYGFAHVFARQIMALGRSNDALIVISTSGSSANILRAIEAARRIDMMTIGLSGRDGGRMAELCDACITVPNESTARIQELHLLVLHCWCSQVDQAFPA